VFRGFRVFVAFVVFSVRVIAGTLKGRRLKPPTWEGLRPTSDKLRETLFNILAPVVEGARVLDGYAGTGAIGLEAISRGAAHVTFVERDRRAQSLIAENVSACGVRDGYVIIRAGIDRAVKTLAPASFDLVLLDPPYDEPLDPIVTSAARLLAADGTLVLEHARRRPSPLSAGGLTRAREVISGDSALAFYSCPP
jgi:16S rRNA (guanine966-N2)-methyltransferase